MNKQRESKRKLALSQMEVNRQCNDPHYNEQDNIVTL